jgi:DNA-binding MarR family transcriptional regulator
MRDRKGWREEWRIPRMWFEELCKAELSGTTWKLALYLLAEAENQFCPMYFKLPNKALAELGISPDAKVRALKELSRLGLILLQKQPRKSPLVKVLWKRRQKPSAA